MRYLIVVAISILFGVGLIIMEKKKLIKNFYWGLLIYVLGYIFGQVVGKMR